ncbi:MAG TPA: hypothetical protein PK859_03425 [Spirochaetota bacterium]|nr:hypothetical protein [Spirochaetota bacterium]HPR47798.1 hypothetical protein [Spirochaetota bacterium]
MKNIKWYLILTLSLLAASAVSYIFQIVIFHNQHDTFFYLLQDLSFVPINVLLVTLIIDKLLEKKEKENLIKKLNMVIGVFYNEIGISLMTLLVEKNINSGSISHQLVVSSQWDDKKYAETIKKITSFSYKFELDSFFLDKIRRFLVERRQTLIELLGNPNLLEHDSFTNMILAVFHLTDELDHRDDFSILPESDARHLSGDLNRAYSLLLAEWLLYLSHLKKTYPYLFSIALRKNPFDSERNIIVTE